MFKAPQVPKQVFLNENMAFSLNYKEVKFTMNSMYIHTWKVAGQMKNVITYELTS